MSVEVSESIKYAMAIDFKLFTDWLMLLILFASSCAKSTYHYLLQNNLWARSSCEVKFEGCELEQENHDTEHE